MRFGSIAFPAIGCILWGIVSYNDERQKAIRHAYDSVELIAQYTYRLVETQTTRHAAAESFLRRDSRENVRGAAFAAFLSDLDSSQQPTYGIAVIASGGEAVALTAPDGIDFRFAREASRQIEAGAELYLDRTTLEPKGEDALLIASPFEVPGFSGAIVSALSAEVSRRFLRNIAARPGEAASLSAGDGTLLIRQVPGATIKLPDDAPARKAIAVAQWGDYEAVAVSDQVRRVYAFRKLEGLPLYANFGVPEALIISDWLWRAVPVWLLLMGAGIFSFYAAGVVRRSTTLKLLADRKQARLAAAQRIALHRAEMMHELNHRVKNNLALINSLISIEMRKKGFIDAAGLQARVKAIADVHDLLFRSGELELVDVGQLLDLVCRGSAILPADGEIRLDVDVVDGIYLPAERASPLALVAAELVTNAVKHAFVGREKGKISVTLRREGEGKARMVIDDDGIGMADTTTRQSGTRLVDAFARQAEAQMHREYNGGTRYVLVFPCRPQEKSDGIGTRVRLAH